MCICRISIAIKTCREQEDSCVAISSGEMQCKFCSKAFSKGEHLRRHERSHTGSRPYMCKDCRRAFSRQDSLIRHEKLHRRKDSSRDGFPVAGGIVLPESPPNSDDTTHVDNVFRPASSHSQALRRQDASIDAALPHGTPPSELDFELIWPDTEELFQSIMSSEASNQWELPLGALPYPSESYPASNISLGTPSSFDDRAPSIGAIPSGGSHRAVHYVSNMVVNLSSTVTAAVESKSITSVFLDECLHMFFTRFIPTFPILHRASFVFRDCSHPLLLNAIAIGSLYLGPKDSVAKGEVLWRLAHTAVSASWQTLITHRGSYDACQGIQLVITAVLGQLYGALSKNSAIRTTSQVFHSLGFFWAGRCNLFSSQPYSMNDLPSPTASKEEKEHQWRVWVSREIQLRAVLAQYMLDGLLKQMSAEPSSARHTSNQLRLPSSEAAFEASTPDEWLNQMRLDQVDQTSFRSVFRLLFSPSLDHGWRRHNYSALSYRVVLEGLQSLISDCEEEAESVVGVPTKSEIRRALARVYEQVAQSPYLPAADRLETLLSWHAVCLDTATSSSLLCSYMCSRCDIDQNVWANRQGGISNFDHGKWALSANGRRALLHAVAIQDIIEQLPRGRAHAIHMPSALFAAATVYSIFSLAGLTTVKLPSTVDWQDVAYDHSIDGRAESYSAMKSDTNRYVRDAWTPSLSSLRTTRNLLYEFNSVQKLFGCLSTQWGVTIDMAKVVDLWIAHCH